MRKKGTNGIMSAPEKQYRKKKWVGSEARKFIDQGRKGGKNGWEIGEKKRQVWAQTADLNRHCGKWNKYSWSQTRAERENGWFGGGKGGRAAKKTRRKQPDYDDCIEVPESNDDKNKFQHEAAGLGRAVAKKIRKGKKPGAPIGGGFQ